MLPLTLPVVVGPICAKGSNISNGLAKNEPVLNPINGIFGNPEIQKTTDFYQLTKYMFEFPELCVGHTVIQLTAL